MVKQVLKSIVTKFSSHTKVKADFKKEFLKKKELLSDNGRFLCRWEDHYAIFGESGSTTDFDAHYVYHTAWAARILAGKKPEVHIDISSDIRFVTLVSSFIPVKFYDYRPVDFTLSNLESKFGDLMALPFTDNSVSSLSCMHVVEHIGLQRYGDPIDAKGDIKAIAELTRVLKPGGHLYFVTPVGAEARIQYNAHRIYTYKMVLSLFPDLILEDFALVTDEGKFINNASESVADKQGYGCGCFLFTKR